MTEQMQTFREEFEGLREECRQMGMSTLTFNRLVTDITLNLIDCDENRAMAARTVRNAAAEVRRNTLRGETG